MVKSRSRRDGGYAIAIALIVMVLVGAAATAIAIGLRLETRTSQQESRRIHLVALGDAAIAEALAELDRSKGFSGSPERELGNGTISSTVRTLGANRVEILGTAEFRGWQHRVTAEVVTSGSTPMVVSWQVTP